ncbi:ROK family protein [Actinocorallia libanotica]|uniref:ROK family protein n=1 Tax=Actinocorallia libanotica TaxID=46162 RepID=A0ABP4BLL1_9ACTN
MAGTLYAGVDIGGTKIAVALVSEEGRIVRQARTPTPAGGGAAVPVAAARLIAELRAGLPGATVAAVGVGSPGVIDRAAGRVVSATDVLPGWAGMEVRATLEELTGVPVTVDNDVRAMAYGEAKAGAGAGFSRVLYVSVGTGIGGALTRDGELEYGAHGTAGETAHLLVPATGAIPCGCGRLDHLEAVASGPAMAAAYAARTGERLPLPEIAARLADDPAARDTVHGAAALLGRALAGLAAVLDPDALVVGGGAAQIGPAFRTPLTEALHAEALPPLRALPVLPAHLGTDAPLIGAALQSKAALTTRPAPHTTGPQTTGPQTASQTGPRTTDLQTTSQTGPRTTGPQTASQTASQTGPQTGPQTTDRQATGPRSGSGPERG